MCVNETINEILAWIKIGKKVYLEKEKKSIGIIMTYDAEKKNVMVASFPLDMESEEVRNLTNSEEFRNALYNPRKRGVILIDVADYSTGGTLYQASILSLMNGVFKQLKFSLNLMQPSDVIEQFIPTGDGCYIIFREEYNNDFHKGLFSIFSEVNVYQKRILADIFKREAIDKKISIRASCALGETDVFYDVNGNKNCYGPGLNEAERILSSGRKALEKGTGPRSSTDTIFYDGSVRNQMEKIINEMQKITPAHKLMVKNLGKLPDKHKNMREIWSFSGFSQHMAFYLKNPAW